MVKELIGWAAATCWVAFCGYYISITDSKLSVFELLLLMPQWCQLTNLVGRDYTVLTPEATIRYCFATVVILTICWYLTLEEDVEIMSTEVSSISEYANTKIVEDTRAEDALLENARCLLDKVDLEYKHCAATIAANNETHGRRVGGEAEWATGETSSEDEDATREITGAHLRSAKEIDDEQILNFLQQSFEEYPEAAKEPHLAKIIEIDDDNDIVKSES